MEARLLLSCRITDHGPEFSCHRGSNDGQKERRSTRIDHALRSRLTRDLPYIGYWLFPALNRKLPTVTVRIVKPEAHVQRAGSFRSDFIARILQIGLDALQMIESFSQRRHVRQMKRHVIDRFRR